MSNKLSETAQLPSPIPGSVILCAVPAVSRLTFFSGGKMIYRSPDYCRDFRCIAGDCKDSCCKGWEIDIDPDTAAYYECVSGEFGERLRRSIRNGSFVLDAEERCPFLNGKGLCDIYTELGRDRLCRICSDHPRYYEWFGSVKEGGVGLCCEAAAMLIISRDMELCEEETPDEEASGEYDEKLFRILLEARNGILALLSDSSISLSEAMCRSLDIAAEIQEMIDLPCKEADNSCGYNEAVQDILRCFAELEPIDDSWLPRITACAEKAAALPAADSSLELYMRRLAAYFVYRYMLKAVYDGEVLGYVKFAAVSVLVIGLLCRAEGCRSPEECALAAKDYSKETEYSEENMADLIGRFRSEAFLSADVLKRLICGFFGGNVDKF